MQHKTRHRLAASVYKTHSGKGLVLEYIKNFRDFPGAAVVKNLPANEGDMGSSPGPGRSHMPRSN